MLWVNVESVDVVVDALPWNGELTVTVVDPIEALPVVELIFFVRVKPTLKPIVRAIIAKVGTPSRTNRLRWVDFELGVATSCDTMDQQRSGWKEMIMYQGVPFDYMTKAKCTITRLGNESKKMNV